MHFRRPPLPVQALHPSPVTAVAPIREVGFAGRSYQWAPEYFVRVCEGTASDCAKKTHKKKETIHCSAVWSEEGGE